MALKDFSFSGFYCALRGGEKLLADNEMSDSVAARLCFGNFFYEKIFLCSDMF